ncbi:MAG: glycogen debranching enzyme GlgX, partial [Candidatus Riflebacteria bacterium]
LSVFLSGTGIDDVDEDGIPLHDGNFLLMLNAASIDAEFYTPAFNAKWELLIDTCDPEKSEFLQAEAQTTMRARSLKLFICRETVQPLPKPAY